MDPAQLGRLSFGPRRELRVIDPWNARGNFQTDGIGLDEFPGKFVQWKPRLFREYPEREGLARRTLYWCFFKRFSWRYRMILTELFALPWRVVKVDPDNVAGVSKEDLTEARDNAEKLGQETTAAMPSGMDLEIVQADKQSHEMFGMTSDQVNAELSKLVLGQTGTTDAVANRAESIVMKSEQDIILQKDAGGLSERITSDLVLPNTVLNFGRDMAPLAPTFVLRAQPPRDQAKEQERADKTISIGVPVAVTQYREITGMREPEPDEAFIVAEPGGVDPMTGKALPAQPKIVDPEGEPDTDDAAAQLPDLEDGGTDDAADRAEADLAEATRGGAARPPFRW